MNLIVLTTNTLHHTFFVQQLSEAYPVKKIFIETKSAQAPFPTEHSFELDRELYEKRKWFGKDVPALRDFAPVVSQPSLNTIAATTALRSEAPDVVVVFGTGYLKQPVIDSCPILLNLHGGDPERYRGLDSHLWAIYHREFDAFDVTLHVVNPVLDDGEIVARKSVSLCRDMALYELRAAVTALCVELVSEALTEYRATGAICSNRQSGAGRYYSFMPAALKDVCVKRFAKYCRKLS